MDKGEQRLEVSIGHIKKERNKGSDAGRAEAMRAKDRESDRQEKKGENERERRAGGGPGDKGGR